ncbi:MAG: hypothetical protein M3T96_00195 [Acidobacteriota bacterium]|nr:hypothetical protein [Acidobacteriota bacterium]
MNTRKLKIITTPQSISGSEGRREILFAPFWTLTNRRLKNYGRGRRFLRDGANHL